MTTRRRAGCSGLPEVDDRTQANLAIVRAPTVALLLAHGRVPEVSDPADGDALVLALTPSSERNLSHVMRSAPTAAELRRTTDRLARIWLRAFGFDDTPADGALRCKEPRAHHPVRSGGPRER